MDFLTHLPLTADCGVVLHRTLRIPDDGRHYPLPPSLGHLPLVRVADDRFIAPMRRAEATWLGFSAPHHKPHVLKVGIGGIDAISGETFAPGMLVRTPQNYVVIPDQPWLDGINAGDGFIRQFVAAPLGEGLTVEGQLTGREVEGGLSLSLFEPRPGRFPERRTDVCERAAAPMCAAGSMGLGAGGRMRQQIFEDRYGISSWQAKPVRSVRIELVDALAFEARTGVRVPGEPIDAETYIRHGLPWFELYAPNQHDIAAAERFAALR